MSSPHPEWIVPDWPAPPRVRALVTTRAGGASRGAFATLNLSERVGDDPTNVRRNREILRGVLPAAPLWLQQVHGSAIVDADATLAEPQADGAVARTPNRVLVVLVADCLPVLLCDRAGTAVGIAHAGWRGLAGGVLENLVRAMEIAPHELIAWLGPGIGPRAYEVGADVRDAFVRAHPAAAAAFAPSAEGKFLADLYALARLRLAEAGVHQVCGGGFCTFSEPRFYSFRRDRITGRMAGLVWLEKNPARGAQ